jgi:hypothetical protein
MKTKFIMVPIGIAILAAILQVIDQLLSGVLPIDNNGFGWIAFQTWALYFLAGADLKGGLKSLLGVISGIVASILIMTFAGTLSGLGFWAVPASLLVLVVPVIWLEKVKWLDFIPAIFVGAGVFFALSSYWDNTTFAISTQITLLYTVIGLTFGYVTVSLRQWYESK